MSRHNRELGEADFRPVNFHPTKADSALLNALSVHTGASRVELLRMGLRALSRELNVQQPVLEEQPKATGTNG